MQLNGLKIRRLRKSMGLSQTDFAKKIGKSLRSVQDYEADKTVPSGDALMKMMEMIGVNNRNAQNIAQLEEPNMTYDVNEEVCRKFSHVTNKELIHMLVVKFDDLIKDPTLKVLIEREALKLVVKMVKEDNSL